MWSGFFKVSYIEDMEVLKQLYKDAIELSFNTYVNEVDLSKSYARISSSLTPIEYIENHLSFKTHNVVIDRFVQFNQTEHGLVGSCTMGLDPEYFLFMELKLDDLYKLVEKYNLPKF